LFAYKKIPAQMLGSFFNAAFNLILTAGAIEVQASRRLSVTTKQGV